MGSGSSSQVKVIDNKAANTTAVTNNMAALPGKDVSAPTRTVVSPNTPHRPVSQEGAEPSPALMAQTPASCALQPPGTDVQSIPSPTSSRRRSSGVPSSSQPGKGASSASGLELKLAQLQRELNESESEKLDLQDRIQALEERLQEVMTVTAPSGDANGKSGKGSPSDLQETLHAKDQYIQRMEKQLAATEAESKKVRVRLKKKIKVLTTQLSEAKQESSIAQLELKEHNAHLQEQLQHSNEGNLSAVAARTAGDDEEDKDSKMKVILDLSAEVSEQSDRICALERQLKERDKELEVLKREAAHTPRQPVPPPLHSDQLRSRHPPHSIPSHHGAHSHHMALSGAPGRGGMAPVETRREYSSTQGARPVSKIGARPGALPAMPPELSLQRQSTALSDSDSDWEMDSSSTKIHSAPARVRVKSATAPAEEKASGRVDGDERWSVITDDNDLTMTSEARPERNQNARQKRRSALKTRLERERNERSKGLMGPSLAFATPVAEQLSDVSCTPTPRHSLAELGSQFTTSDVMAFAV